VVFGISADKPSAQKKFKEKYDLPYPLLADVDKVVVKKFGVLKEKSMYGKKYMGIERTTFVINRRETSPASSMALSRRSTLRPCWRR